MKPIKHKHLSVAAALVFTMASVAAAVPKDGQHSRAAELFVEAPTAIFPSVDSLTRLDMVDYFLSGSDRASKNLFNGHARVTRLTADQITVETSAAARKDISLIPRAGSRDTVVMVVTTVQTPAEDSTVKFYDMQWQPIDKGLFIVPTLDDWTLDQARGKRQDLENAVPFMLAKISYEPATSTLTLVNNLGAYLPEEVTGLVGSSLKGELRYRWDGHKMVQVK